MKSKKGGKRNKKFWSGIFLTIIGAITMFVSYIGYNFLEEGSWLWSMQGEIAGIGLPILIVGIILIIFNKDVTDVVN